MKAISQRCKVIYQYLSTEEENVHENESIEYFPMKYIRSSNIVKELFKRRYLDRKICQLVRNEVYDILYMHHFPATMPVEPFRIAKRRKKKIIYDIHEYHPQNFLANLPTPLNRIKERIMWKIFEEQIKLSDKLVFVSEEVMEDVFKIINFKKPYIVVPNYASFSLNPEKKKKDEICFVGKTSRSLSQKEIQILEKLTKEGILFKVIGMNANFGIQNSKVFSFLPYEEMMREISKSKFSWISYQPFSDYKNYFFALPHKFFDSIAAGTPVIVSKSFVSMAKIVESKRIGVIIDSENVEESVKKIKKAFSDYKEIIENVEKYQKEFVWDKEKEEKFLDFVLT